MKTNCGVNFQDKLDKKTPWARFDYIRLWIMKKLKGEDKEYKHLEIANLRKAAGLSAKHIKLLQSGVVDYESYVSLAREINEKYDMLVFECENKVVGKPPSDIPAAVIKKTTKRSASKSKLGLEIEFINHHIENLGLMIDGNKIHIYENNFDSEKADYVLIGRTRVFIKGKEKEKIFPQTIKV